MNTKFAFLNRNDEFYADNKVSRDSATGNSFVNDNNIDEFDGIQNVYALVSSASKSGYKSYYFDYARFVKNCTPKGSMIFGKAYRYREESVKGYGNTNYSLNKKTYQYDINNVGEYDGYYLNASDAKIAPDYNYAVRVDDGNLAAGKTSYDIFKYTYIGEIRDKTILLTRLTDCGTDHNVVTDYSYDNTTKLLTAISWKDYSIVDPSDCMATSKTYTYDDGNYGDVLTETRNGAADRATSYTYDENYHFPTSTTYKQT